MPETQKLSLSFLPLGRTAQPVAVESGLPCGDTAGTTGDQQLLIHEMPVAHFSSDVANKTVTRRHPGNGSAGKA